MLSLGAFLQDEKQGPLESVWGQFSLQYKKKKAKPNIYILNLMCVSFWPISLFL